jgi:hypothetical protein
MEDRQKAIRDKGFNMIAPSSSPSTNFARIKLPNKVVDDATIDLGYYKKLDKANFRSKHFVIQALIDNNIPLLRQISAYYYRTNGIYQKIINYFATMYRYDWYAVPEIFSDNAKEDAVVKEFK